MRHLFSLFISFVLVLSFSPFGWALFQQPTEAEQQLDQQLENSNQCDQFKEQGIKQYCTGNPLYQEAQRKQASCAMLNQGAQQAQSSPTGSSGAPGIGTTALQAQACLLSAKNAINQTSKVCKEAVQKCGKVCNHDYNQASSNYTTAMSSTPPNQQAASQFDQQMKEYQAISDTCNSEMQTTEAKATAMQMDIGTMLTGIASILSALGLNQGADASVASLDEEEEDKCEGEYADLLIECKQGASDPKGTRAGLGGTASLVGKPGLGLAGLTGEPNGGEPGGTSKDNGNGGAGSGFQAAGVGSGGFGSGSGAGSSDIANGAAQEGLDTDVLKGYSGGFGGGGGSDGGSGSGSGSKGSFFNGSKPFSTAGFNSKAALNRKLNKFKSGVQQRSPASAGGANGPFNSNWEVVNKAYKKNSSSLYHQQ